MITNLIIVVNGVVIFDGHSQLDNLLQKPLRYHHHRENYIQSLREGVIATGLKLKKNLAINYISDGFEVQWKKMIHDAEKRLVELLHSESEILIDKTQRQVNEVIISIYDGNLEEKRDELYKKHISKYEQQLKERRQRKWENIKNSNFEQNVKASVPGSKISSVSQTATDLQKENKVVNFPRKDTSKPVTEPNSSQVEFDVVEDLKVDEKLILFGRRKGNKEWSYAEVMQK